MTGGYSIFHGTMADLPYPAVEAAAAAGAGVLVPSGVIEQHGPHLPLGTDAYAAYLLCRRLAEELAARGRQVLIAPPLFWGVNHVSASFAGTFRTRPETAAALHDDVLDSLFARPGGAVHKLMLRLTRRSFNRLQQAAFGGAA